MKKFATFFILLFLTSISYSQETGEYNFSIGINSGATYSRIKSYFNDSIKEPNFPDNTQKFCVGYYWGASINYKINPGLIVTTEINYMVNKISYTIHDMSYNRDSLLVNTYAVMKDNTHTLNIPLLISYNLLKKENTPFVTLGAAINIYLGSHQKYKIHGEEDKIEVATGESKERRSEYNKWNIPIAFGGGYKYRLSKKYDLLAQGIYNLSTKQLLQKKVKVYMNHKINCFQLGIGLNYKL